MTRGAGTGPGRIVHALSPAQFGGLERVVELLSAAQLAAGHQVHVIASVGPHAGEHPFVASLRRRQVPVIPLDFPSRAYLAERAELRRQLRQLAPDVVHTHGYRSDVLTARIAGRLGYRTVSTAHGLTGGNTKNRIYEWMQVRTWRSMDAVVAVSRPLEARLRADGVAASRLHWIPNAWSQDGPLVSRAEARLKLGLPAEGPLVGWVGRLSREKGADVMLSAMPLLASTSARLVVIGDGPERSALEETAQRLEIANRIHWLGAVLEVGRYCGAFDCFALSSRTEGTPMVLFEAMAAGVPVVATQVGGVPDVVSSAEAILVPSEDPLALARAVDLTLSDSAGANLRAAAARQRLQAEFSVPHWVSAYDAVYQRVLAGMQLQGTA